MIGCLPCYVYKQHFSVIFAAANLITTSFTHLSIASEHITKNSLRKNIKVVNVVLNNCKSSLSNFSNDSFRDVNASTKRNMAMP